MTTTQESDDFGRMLALFVMGLGILGICLAALILVTAAFHGDWQFVAVYSGSIGVAAAVLYGTKWYRRSYFATRRRQSKIDRVIARKG